MSSISFVTPAPIPVPVPVLDTRWHPVAVIEQMKNTEPQTQVGKIVLFVLIKPTEEAKTERKRLRTRLEIV